MASDESIVFRREAHQEPGLTSGDVVIHVETESHPVFKRNGPHLEMTRKISLAEALSGFQFDVKTLDNRILKIRSDPNGTVCIGKTHKVVKGEGLPVAGSQSRKGDLYVRLEVDTTRLPFKDREQVAKLFGLQLAPLVAPTGGVVVAQDTGMFSTKIDFDDGEKVSAKKGKKSASREYEQESESQGGRQQCAQM
jgi:DnaJ-class molecular chaperone